jgi:glutamate-1-semialdehyde 2,1-aminomutase
LRLLFAVHGLPAQVLGLGSMFGFYFTSRPVKNFEDAKAADTLFFKRFYHAMLKQGIYLAPSAFEAGFISSAHSNDTIDETLERTSKALKSL